MSGLRVIAGRARGRRLKSVPGDATRPITDRVKESLFNIIGPDIQDASILDLFAGTGSVGIEALSRGAKYARFLDLNRQAIDTIHANLALTGLGGSAEVIRMDAFTHLERTPDRSFDYVYVAPPQYRELWKQALLRIDANTGWLASDAWVIAQIHPVEYEDLNLKSFQEFDQRRYGSTIMVFYQANQADA